MGERQRQPEEMATTSTAVTVSPQVQEPAEPVAVITLRHRPATRKKVVWTEDTVDNEHMNKKKSKCCCIFHKRRDFGESDSEDSDDECEHCTGHVEKRPNTSGTVSVDVQDGPKPEPTATLTLVVEPAARAPAAPLPGEPSTSM